MNSDKGQGDGSDIVLRLVGQKSDDPLVQEFLDKIISTADTQRDVKRFSDCVYWNYKGLGLSLMFNFAHGRSASTANAKDLILDSVILYNKGAYGYRRYHGPMPLPRMKFEKMSNKDVVQRFGEPLKKGGGGIAPIWFTYSTKQPNFARHVREELSKESGNGSSSSSSSSSSNSSNGGCPAFSMQIELVDKDWNNTKNAVASITIFPEE